MPNLMEKSRMIKSNSRESVATKQKEYNWGIDFLRIVSMFMVVCLHMLGRGGILDYAPFLSGKYEVVWLIEIAAYCAVNCYALISGYVGIHGKYRYSNWVLLWLRVLFYSILITVFFKFAAPSVVGRYEWTSAVFPTSREQYWYFTAYTGLFLLIPVLNFFISHASRKQLKLVVMLGIVLYSVLPELFRRDIFVTKEGYSPIWMIVLYIIGGYLGKYQGWKKKSKRHLGFIYIVCIAVTWLGKFVIEHHRFGVSGDTNQTTFLVSYTSPTILLAGIALVILFSKLNVTEKWKKFIKLFAPVSFSVYLIHFHPLVKAYILQDRLKGLLNYNVVLMLLAFLAIIVSVYFICSFIDMIREYIFKKLKVKDRLIKLEHKYLENTWDNIERKG